MAESLYDVIGSGGGAQRVELALQADPSACSSFDPRTGESPLHLAARLGQVGTVRRLLRCAAPLNAPAYNGSRATPLHLAAAHGHTQVAEVLLQTRANPTAVDSKGMVPARYAEANGHHSLAERLDEERRNAGDFELADLGRLAAKGFNEATDSLASAFAGFGLTNVFGDSQEAKPRPAAPEAPFPKPPAPAAPNGSVPGSRPAPASPVSAKPPSQRKLEAIVSRVEAVESVVDAGHLRDARGWQDELTKAACELDGMDLAPQSHERGVRRELLHRIEVAGTTIDERMDASARRLLIATEAVDEAEASWRLGDGGPSELKALDQRLSAATDDLDAVQCATEAQRTQRRNLLKRIEILESEIRPK
ncbi:ANKRD27 [Symbiodinium sp. CCMP2592]|nr:ANKRD27 [Symbiodinium sp. CCMP2592]